MDEVEAVARAVHGELSRIDAMKYLDMPDDTAERVAQAAIAALDAARGNAEPVAWRYERHATGERPTTVFATYAWRSGRAGWTEAPLYLSPPVGDRPLASNSVDDSETGNTTDKLRDAVEVWLHHSGYEGNADVEQAVREFAAVIEADRAQCLAALQAHADAMAGALKEMHHAVCHETGFAAAVRQDSGLAYPWEPLDIAEVSADAALRAYEEFRRG